MSLLWLKLQRPQEPFFCQSAVGWQWWNTEISWFKKICALPMNSASSFGRDPTLGVFPHPWLTNLHSCLTPAPSKQSVGRCLLCQHLCRFKKLKPMAVSCYVFGRGEFPRSHVRWMQIPCFILQLDHSPEPLCCQGLWGAILHLEGSDEWLQALMPSTQADK